MLDMLAQLDTVQLTKLVTGKPIKLPWPWDVPHVKPTPQQVTEYGRRLAARSALRDN